LIDLRFPPVKNKKEIELYNEYQGKYHTLYLDFSSQVDYCDTLESNLNVVAEFIKEDLKIYI